MNIFVLHEDPIKAAEAHVIKMKLQRGYTASELGYKGLGNIKKKLFIRIA